MLSNDEKIQQAIQLIDDFGSTDGEHHKMWVIDQLARILAGENYALFIKQIKHGEDGPNTYSWDEGIAP